MEVKIPSLNLLADPLELPSLNLLADSLEDIPAETLREVVGQLVLGVYLFNLNDTLADMLPEVMPFDQKVLGPVGDSVACSELQSSTIIFESPTMDGSSTFGRNTEGCHCFKEQGSQMENSS